MIAASSIVVRPFGPADQRQVKELISSGLEEHWGHRDDTKNPDLDDIGRAYAHAVFLVACDEDRIVATGALVPRSAGVAEIVRMSVARDRRRCGIGATMLRALFKHAERQAVRTLVLETTESWREVIQFYLAQGFRITHHAGGDAHFAIDLPATSEPVGTTPIA